MSWLNGVTPQRRVRYCTVWRGEHACDGRCGYTPPQRDVYASVFCVLFSFWLGTIIGLWLRPLMLPLVEVIWRLS